MRCSKAQEWLRMRADEPRRAADQRHLATHVAECAKCTGYGRDLEQLAELVAATASEEPSSSFDWRLKLQLAKAERGELAEFAVVAPAPRRAGLQFGAAMAAAAAVVVFIGTATLQQHDLKPATTLPASLVARKVPVEIGGVVTPVRDPGRGPERAVNTSVTRVPYAPYMYFGADSPQTSALVDSAPRADDTPAAAH